HRRERDREARTYEGPAFRPRDGLAPSPDKARRTRAGAVPNRERRNERVSSRHALSATLQSFQPEKKPKGARAPTRRRTRKRRERRRPPAQRSRRCNSWWRTRHSADQPKNRRWLQPRPKQRRATPATPIFHRAPRSTRPRVNESKSRVR